MAQSDPKLSDFFTGTSADGKPLTIIPAADPMVLEHLVCEKRLSMLLNGNGNGAAHGNGSVDGNDNGGNDNGGNGNGGTQAHENNGGNGNRDQNAYPEKTIAAADSNTVPAATQDSPLPDSLVTDQVAGTTAAPTPAQEQQMHFSKAHLDFFAQNPPPPPYISNSFAVREDDKPPAPNTVQTSKVEDPFFSAPVSSAAKKERAQIQEVDSSASTEQSLTPAGTSAAGTASAPAPAVNTLDTSTDASTVAGATAAIAQAVAASSSSTNAQNNNAAATAPPRSDVPSSTASDTTPAALLFRRLGQFMTFIENGVVIAGHRRSFAGFAVASIVVFFVGNLLMGSVGGLLGGVSGIGSLISQRPPEVSLSGQWVTNYVFRRRPFQGRMIVQQSGNQLSGYGRDPGYFEFTGTLNGNQVHLNKVYFNPATKSKVGFPVVLDGVVTKWEQGRLDMHGIYVTSVKQGVFLHAHIATIEGSWQADLVSNTVPSAAPPTLAPSGSGIIPSFNKTEEFQSFLLKIAGGFLLLGIAIVVASLKMFGPNGLVNIWAKKEYIPSQFKSHHHKMMWELGKSIRPGCVPLGERLDWSLLSFYKPKKLAIPKELRNMNPHILILGGGDKGKTRLMANMIVHDIQDNDRAVVVIDSDGGLVDLIIRWVASQPNGRQYAEHVILVDPTHTGGDNISPAYNPLEMPADGDLQAAASAIVFGFKAVYTEPPGSQSQWNQQTANILRNSALLLIANGKTLVDLPVLLSDNDFRDVLLDSVEKRKDERVEFVSLLETWNQYKRLARTDQWINWVEPILNRVTPMLSDPRIRTILTKPKGDLNLREIISKGKTLLVKVPHGQLDQNADLLGSLIVTGLKQAALSLANGGSQQHPCALYLDEFDNFIEKETFDAFTHETHKFQIGLACAVKTLQHLPEDFRNELSINVGTICAFSLGKKDADMLGPQMFRVDGRKIKHQTMQNIFNRVNSSFHFELISDEEKLNIDRVIGLEEKTYFCYRVGSIAGVFLLRAFEFPDIPDEQLDHALLQHLYATDNVRAAPTQVVS